MARRSDSAKKAALAADLEAMFKTLEARPVPSVIRSVVDQLDEGEPDGTRAKKGRGRG